jgi:DNA-binding SARP family transcriptional activator
MEFRLLGPLEVVEHDRSLALGAPKQRSFLALFLLHAKTSSRPNRSSSVHCRGG